MNENEIRRKLEELAGPGRSDAVWYRIVAPILRERDIADLVIEEWRQRAESYSEVEAAALKGWEAERQRAERAEARLKEAAERTKAEWGNLKPTIDELAAAYEAPAADPEARISVEFPGVGTVEVPPVVAEALRDIGRAVADQLDAKTAREEADALEEWEGKLGKENIHLRAQLEAESDAQALLRDERDEQRQRAERAEPIAKAVESAKATQSAVEIASVRIEPCDYLGRTETTNERDRLREAIAKYEEAITWETTCLNCSNLTTKLYDRDAALARVRKLRARLANSNLDALGARFVLTELDAALDGTDSTEGGQ